jgi:hypothetical protein
MPEDEKRQDEDTEGEGFRYSVSPEGTEEDSKGQAFRYGVGNEESDVEDAEGHKRSLGNEESDVEDDTEGQVRRP